MLEEGTAPPERWRACGGFSWVVRGLAWPTCARWGGAAGGLFRYETSNQGNRLRIGDDNASRPRTPKAPRGKDRGQLDRRGCCEGVTGRPARGLSERRRARAVSPSGLDSPSAVVPARTQPIQTGRSRGHERGLGTGGEGPGAEGAADAPHPGALVRHGHPSARNTQCALFHVERIGQPMSGNRRHA